MCILGLFNDVFQQQWANSPEKKMKLSFKDFSARIWKGDGRSLFQCPILTESLADWQSYVITKQQFFISAKA